MRSPRTPARKASVCGCPSSTVTSGAGRGRRREELADDGATHADVTAPALLEGPEDEVRAGQAGDAAVDSRRRQCRGGGDRFRHDRACADQGHVLFRRGVRGGQPATARACLLPAAFRQLGVGGHLGQSAVMMSTIEALDAW